MRSCCHTDRCIELLSESLNSNERLRLSDESAGWNSHKMSVINLLHCQFKQLFKRNDIKFFRHGKKLIAEDTKLTGENANPGLIL
ncbi:hypothetical protein DSECCO2_521870 [anaerobic digester metagenome]